MSRVVAALVDRQGRTVASVPLEVDMDAVRAAYEAGAHDGVTGHAPDVLLHGGGVFVRRAGLDYQQVTVGGGVEDGPSRLNILAQRVLRADTYGESAQAWYWAVELAQRALLVREEELAEEVRALRAAVAAMTAVAGWQSDRFHPLTCGNDSGHRHLVPVWDEEASRVVLLCPDCDYRQGHIPDVVLRWVRLRGVGGVGLSQEALAAALEGIRRQWELEDAP